MPEIKERLKRQLAAKGNKNAEGMAIALLHKMGHMKNGKLTEKGKKRNSMSPGERAKDRAAKYSKTGKPSEYKYNKKTNRATKKK